MEKQKLIYVESKAQFSPSEVSDKAIVFIKDTKEIWTHGVYFSCSGTWATPITLSLTGDTTGSVSIDGSGNASIATTTRYLSGMSSSSSDCNSAATTQPGNVTYYPCVLNSATNKFPTSNNANGILSLNVHDYSYTHQLGFSSDGNIYHRRRSGGTWETTWKTILSSTNYTKYPHTFASLTNKPTTLSGYGITDCIPIISGGKVTTDTNLSTLGMTSSGEKLSIFYQVEGPYPSWLNVPYMSVLMFHSRYDYYGAIGIEMEGSHTVQFIGGRTAETTTNNVPNWWFRIKGASGTTYDLNSFQNTVNNLDSNYLRKSGGTMTGILTLTTDAAYITDSKTQHLIFGTISPSTTTGVTGVNGMDAVFVGRLTNMVLRTSGNNLWHYNHANQARYLILDANNYTNYTINYANSGINTYGSVGVIANGKLYYNNAISFARFAPEDNGGATSYELIAELTNYGTGTNTSYVTYGISGFMWSYRAGNCNNSSAYPITAIVSVGPATMSRIRVPVTTNVLIPFIVKYNNKYYLALKKSSSSTDFYFMGQKLNLLTTTIKVNDASLIEEIQGPETETSTARYYYNNGTPQEYLHAGNYSSYALPLTGGTLTGTLISRDIRPSANVSYSLGTSSYYYNYVYAKYFKKNGSSDSYVLLGGGGHKAVSDFAPNNVATLSSSGMGNSDQWTLVFEQSYPASHWYEPIAMFYVKGGTVGCGILCFYNYWNSATKLNAYEKEVWFFGAGKSETSATFGGTNRDINDYLRIYIDTANFKYYIYYNRYNDRDVKIQELQFFESPDPLHSSFFTNSTTVVNLPTESSTLVRVPIKTTYNHDRTIKTSKSIYASSFYENSDIRLKENIRRIDQSDLTKQVDLVQFNFKDSDTKKYGVIAQQLEQVGLQNLVYENDGKKAVDYISLLVLEIQRLRNEIGELKQEIHKKS